LKDFLGCVKEDIFVFVAKIKRFGEDTEELWVIETHT
jgi:hypothetical protein